MSALGGKLTCSQLVCSTEETWSMASPLVNAAIFLAVAGVTSAAGRQFRARAEGKPTYLSFLDGRLWLVAILVVATVAVTSGLVTIVNDGSAVMFWEFF